MELYRRVIRKGRKINHPGSNSTSSSPSVVQNIIIIYSSHATRDYWAGPQYVQLKMK
uniref:Uncharacterized protein n=1 Tax=Arundo donax TaxID=35708 RepID=A0A0A8XY45_ARUDO